MLKRILVAVHDAGAAELISSMIVSEKHRYEFSVVVSKTAPAQLVFERKGLAELLVIWDMNNNAKALLDSTAFEMLLVGTGTSGFEHQFVKAAKERDISTVAWLDHWTNYRERFGYPKGGWEDNLPDWIAVSDSKAYKMANDFGFSRLLKLKNYYMSDLITKYNNKTSKAKRTLLYVSESFEEHAEKLGVEPVVKQTEILADILKRFTMLSKKLAVDNIVVRLHPAEAFDKYDSLLSIYENLDIKIERPSDINLNESIGAASVVIGVSSMALINSVLIGCPTISYCPDDRLRSLPLPEGCWVNSLDEIGSDLTRYCPVDDRLIDIYEEHNFSKMIEMMESTTVENSSHH